MEEIAVQAARRAPTRIDTVSRTAEIASMPDIHIHMSKRPHWCAAYCKQNPTGLRLPTFAKR